MALPAELEEKLAKKHDVHDWNRPDQEYRKPARRRQPFRAIVKDLAKEDVPLTEKVLKKILRHLKRIRRQNVYPMDVEARNYKGGLLVDFSIAITLPHYLFEIKMEKRVRIYKRQDLQQWQSLVEESGVKTWERALRSSEYCKKLRSTDDQGHVKKTKKK